MNTGRVIGKDTTSVIVFRADKAGEYAYFCTVPGHRAAGMERQGDVIAKTEMIND